VGRQCAPLWPTPQRQRSHRIRLRPGLDAADDRRLGWGDVWYYLSDITDREPTMRVTSKGQVTIPQDIRDRAGLPPGAEVEFEIGVDGVVRLRRKTDQPGDPQLDAAIARLRGRASKAMTTDDIMALTRG
jgi:AbrB family looped-hinge helix DNA binding protein